MVEEEKKSEDEQSNHNPQLQEFVDTLNRSLSWKRDLRRVCFTVFITLIVYAFLSNFPLPAPDMKIVSLENRQPIHTSLDVQVKISNGFFSSLLNYLYFDSDYPRRYIKYFSLDPKIWVLVHNHDCFCDNWDVFEKLEDFHHGTANASVQFGVDNVNFDIAVITVNNKDDQYYQGYKETLRDVGGNQHPLPFPASGHVLDEITVHTYNSTRNS